MLLSNVSELPGVSELSGVSELTRVSELSSVSLRLRARAMSIYQRILRAGAHGAQAPTTTQTPPKKTKKKNVLRATPMRCWFSLRAPPDVLASSPQWARSKPPTCKSPTHTLYRRFAYYTRKRPIAARQTRLRIPSGLTKHRVTLRPNRGQRLAPLFLHPLYGML